MTTPMSPALPLSHYETDLKEVRLPVQVSDLPNSSLSDRLSATDYLLNRSWAEVDLRRIRDNMRSIRQTIRRHTEICAVVKADAYGHGVAEVVPIFLANGASRLAVSMLDEAIELRRAGIEVPIGLRKQYTVAIWQLPCLLRANGSTGTRGSI
jgi:predicted amino acid racemase